MTRVHILVAIAFSAIHPLPHKVHPHGGRGPFERPYVVASVPFDSGHDPFADDRQVHVVFSEVERRAGRRRHEIAWWAHCNDSQGPIRIRPDRIHLVQRELSSTAVGCFGRPNREDRWLWHFFGGDPTWNVRHGRLILRTYFETLVLRPT